MRSAVLALIHFPVIESLPATFRQMVLNEVSNEEKQMHDRRFPASEVHRLDNLERLQWLPLEEVLRHLALRPGQGG